MPQAVRMRGVDDASSTPPCSPQSEASRVAVEAGCSWPARPARSHRARAAVVEIAVTRVVACMLVFGLAGCHVARPPQTSVAPTPQATAPSTTTKQFDWPAENDAKIEEDCGRAPREDPDVHVARGTGHLDCTEARRVLAQWHDTPSGRSAGYFRTFENWECVAPSWNQGKNGNADTYMVACSRADGALAYLYRP
jgi:hypothetical protein